MELDEGRCTMKRMLVVTILSLGACAGGEDVRFSEPQVLSAATGVGATPMFAVSAEGREAVAWVSAEGGGTDGRLHVRVDTGPAVTLVDSLGPIQPHGEAPPKLAWSSDGALHALWVVGKLVPGRRFPVSALRHARSSDGGRTWSDAVTVTDDTLVFGSHNFHALHAAANGDVIAAWLDGREGQSAAFLARSSDGGTTWGTNTRLSTGEACPCCRTAIASSVDGSVWVAWRSVMAGNVRDIVVARSRDGGATFGEAERVHADDWVFEACPHAGPALLTDSLGRLHIAWWTGKEGRSGVWYARSDDGETFSAPRALSAMGAMRPVHVQLAIEGGTVVAAWDDATEAMPRVMTRVSRDGGETFEAARALSPEGTAASFPVVGLAKGRLTVAWTEKRPEAHQHEEASKTNMRDPKAVQGLPAVGQASVVVRRALLAPTGR
jgi:hypothetical protein